MFSQLLNLLDDSYVCAHACKILCVTCHNAVISAECRTLCWQKLHGVAWRSGGFRFVFSGKKYTCSYTQDCVGNIGVQHEDFCQQLIRLKSKEKTVEMPHSAHSCVWCWNWDSSESRSGITGKFLMWCWRRTEKISWADRVRNEEVLRW